MNDDLRRMIHEEAESARAGGRIMEIAPEVALEILAEVGMQREAAILLAARLTEVDAERLAIRDALQRVRGMVALAAGVIPLLREIDVALATDSGRLILTELEAARAAVGVVREVLARETSMSALTVALDAYDRAVRARGG